MPDKVLKAWFEQYLTYIFKDEFNQITDISFFDAITSQVQGTSKYIGSVIVPVKLNIEIPNDPNCFTDEKLQKKVRAIYEMFCKIKALDNEDVTVI
jgi:hypothetical protein